VAHRPLLFNVSPAQQQNLLALTSTALRSAARRNYRGATWPRRPGSGESSALADVTGRYTRVHGRETAWQSKRHGIDRDSLRSSVRAGSVSQRSRTGSSGHQGSPAVRRNRWSLALQLRQLGGWERAIRIVVPKVGGSSPLGHPTADQAVRPSPPFACGRPDGRVSALCHRRASGDVVCRGSAEQLCRPPARPGRAAHGYRCPS
jgi:hypothetical protein